MKVKIIGAGLAGCECALYLAGQGKEVELCDIKPKAFTPAHKDKNFGELVCSNSLKSKDTYGNACALLKEEMRILGSHMLGIADKAEVEAGNAQAVDRTLFARLVTEEITKNENITVKCEEVKKIDGDNITVVATGPLTSPALAEDIKRLCGGGLYFYDASAPIVSKDSLNFEKCFYGDRYGKGGDDYINCPLDKEQYERFVEGLISAEKTLLHNFEKGEIFEGCMPVEVLASRGKDSLRFANLKPVGITDKDGNKFYAVLQLRKEDKYGLSYNLVGCQTNLKFGEQKRVFSYIPALERAEFLRYGVMHRNTYINSPECLNADFSLKSNGNVFFAGQITGVEGYVESMASGLMCAVHILNSIKGRDRIVPDLTTVTGALSAHISTPNKNFQPMNANYGLLPPLSKEVRDKKQRYKILSERAIKNITEYKRKLN